MNQKQSTNINHMENNQRSKNNNQNGFSENVKLWIKELRLPASVTGINSNFHLGRDPNSSWSGGYAHQAWRYGIVIKGEDERALVCWLNNIRDWIQENI